jgi:hypothetical protein
MSAKRDKFPKGRRTKPLTMSKALRKTKSSAKTAVRTTRKQRDVSVEGGKRKVDKAPRKLPAAVAARRKGG